MGIGMKMAEASISTATVSGSTVTMLMSTPTTPGSAISTTASTMSMSMGGGTCKLSMLLNWNTIDTCFLFPSFQIRSSFGFFATCLGAFLLVISLEFLRRLQRQFDAYLKAKNKFLAGKDNEYVGMEEEMEEKLLKHDGEETDAGGSKRRWKPVVSVAVVLEQLSRGVIHMLQFSVSYCIMLLFMYSNGYIIISILFGALTGFAMFTRDTLYLRSDSAVDDRDKACC